MRRLQIILFILLGSLAGLGFFTAVYARGHAYLSNNPKACIQCHVMNGAFDSWQKSPHHAVATCNECHLPMGPVTKWLAKAENGFFHSAHFTLNSYPDPIKLRARHKGALLDNCLRCHSGLTGDLHAGRGRFKERLDCIRCHSGVAHGAAR